MRITVKEKDWLKEMKIDTSEMELYFPAQEPEPEDTPSQKILRQLAADKELVEPDIEEWMGAYDRAELRAEALDLNVKALERSCVELDATAERWRLKYDSSMKALIASLVVSATLTMALLGIFLSSWMAS